MKLSSEKTRGRGRGKNTKGDIKVVDTRLSAIHNSGHSLHLF